MNNNKEKQSERSEHTPTPWVEQRASNGIDVEIWMAGADGGPSPDAEEPIVTVRGDADAQIIVRAVNSHEALLEVAQVLIKELPELIRQTPYGVPMSVATAFDSLKSLLTQVEGKP